MIYVRNCSLCHTEVTSADRSSYLRALRKKQVCRKCYDTRRHEAQTSSKLIDLTGQIINNNYIIKICLEKSKHGQVLWLTECVNCKLHKNKLATQIKMYGGCRNCSGLPSGYVGLLKLFKVYSSQASKSGKMFDLSIEQFRILTSSNCDYCGIEPRQLTKNYNKSKNPPTWGNYYFNGIDRKNNNIGYIWNNCLPCCWTCNQAKKAQSYEKFTSWLDRITKFKNANIPKIYVLCGMISSGKSTYCKNAAKHGFVIINDDNIVKLLHADDYTLYDKELKVLYKMTENQILGTSLAMHRSVIIDRGLNVSKRGRQRWIALAKSFDVRCEAIVFHRDKPEVHAKRRFESDNRGHSLDYWLNVANEHNKIYNEPTLEEGFDNVHHINFQDVKCGVVV